MYCPYVSNNISISINSKASKCHWHVSQLLGNDTVLQVPFDLKSFITYYFITNLLKTVKTKNIKIIFLEQIKNEDSWKLKMSDTKVK